MKEFLIRISAFVRKEIVAIVRQPRLLATLILGPFLILALFGIGYNNTPRVLRTVMVIPVDSVIKDEINGLLSSLRGGLDIVDTVDTKEVALEMLGEGEVDLILVTPVDPYTNVLNSEQSEFELLHREIDPIEGLYIDTLNRVYVNVINEVVLTRAVEQAKARASNVQAEVETSQTDAAMLRSDLEAGDGPAAVKSARVLADDLQALNTAIGDSFVLFQGVQSLSDQEDTTNELDDSLDKLEDTMTALLLLDEAKNDFSVELQEVDAIERELDNINNFLITFDSIQGKVLVAPFTGTAVWVGERELGPIDFYVPGALALLLQHMAITLAALSVVRERAGGALEQFRAAPISALETLMGKTVSFLVLGFLLGIILSLLIVFGLNVPLLGNIAGYLLVMLGLLFASLSLGFAISVISETDSQAVQLSMIVLLASIFFSGFFLALYRLADFVHVVSWMLPATYGTLLLQDIMLRGQPIEPMLIAGVYALGLVYFLFAWWRLHHLMDKE